MEQQTTCISRISHLRWGHLSRRRTTNLQVLHRESEQGAAETPSREAERLLRISRLLQERKYTGNFIQRRDDIPYQYFSCCVVAFAPTLCDEHGTFQGIRLILCFVCSTLRVAVCAQTARKWPFVSRKYFKSFFGMRPLFSPG